MSRSAPAEPGAIPALRHELVRYAAEAGANETVRRAVELAVSEALTNVVLYAYQDAASPGSMTVEASNGDGYRAVVVIDRGCGMVPRSDSAGLGLGLGLIAQLADELRIDTGPTTTAAPGSRCASSSTARDRRWADDGWATWRGRAERVRA